MLTDGDALTLDIPRDRAGTFTPQLVPKHVRRLPGFDQKVLSLYARGLTTREIQGHLEELYQIEITPSVISTVTDAVLEEVTQWQQRPLEPVYPVVLFDCLRVKIRDEGVVRNKAVYVALGVDRAGRKDVLGLWVEQTEGASFWLRVMTELKGRGVEVDYASVLENIERRDEDDLKREADPLLKAPDAIEIDNSDLSSAEQFDLALGHVVKVIGEVAEA